MQPTLFLERDGFDVAPGAVKVGVNCVAEPKRAEKQNWSLYVRA
jgi:hypothetical protein